MLVPNNIAPPETDASDPRCGHFIRTKHQPSPRVVIIGFPCDEGVRRNGGRVGAAQAPDLIRRALYKLTPDPRAFERHCQVLQSTLDLGNIEVVGDLEQDQWRLGEIVAEWLALGVCPVIIGGGHETAMGHFLGYVQANKNIQILNVDAHADVRPLRDGAGHSGSPFRQALEHPSRRCAGYRVFGLAPWAVAKAHLAYLDEMECSYTWMAQTNAAALEAYFDRLDAPTMVTLDMDAVSQESAPGVSAPAAAGLSLATFLHGAYLAGRSDQVSSLDLVEVNPQYDIDARTIKAAALSIWHFLRGFAERAG